MEERTQAGSWFSDPATSIEYQGWIAGITSVAASSR
jgi:hypothetical protein